MKKLIIFILAITTSFVGIAQKAKQNVNLQKDATVASTQYSCPMHSGEVSDKPGTCSRCGMNLALSQKEQMKSGVMKSYNCPVHSTEVSDKAGKCPVCGMALKQNIIASVAYSCPMHPGVVSDTPVQCSKCGMNLTLTKKEQMKTQVTNSYGCPMHPDVKSESAGMCPKCGMAMVKTKRGTGQTTHFLNEQKPIPDNQ